MRLPKCHFGQGLAPTGYDLSFEEFENLAADLGARVDPLKREQDGGELAAALGWNKSYLDGNDVKPGLDLKVAAHGNQ